MKNFFSKLFGKSTQVINFKRTTRTVAQVLDSREKGPKRDMLYSGFISEVDFGNRMLFIEDESRIYKVHFDMIVSMSRMNDGRIRIWIKEGAGE